MDNSHNGQQQHCKYFSKGMVHTTKKLRAFAQSVNLEIFFGMTMD
jgi:hypothetical protein